MAVKNSVATVVAELAAPAAGELGLELVDVEFLKEGGRWILRVFIDKDIPGGVTHNDCEALSQRLDVLLDEADHISQTYYLEVSSPGIERPLKKQEDFRKFAGHMVNITTYAPLAGRKKFTGKLEGTGEGVLLIEEEGRSITIPMDQISSAKLHVKI
ncbi:MAG: ribosome maturation factor RimP [Actinobacteria bacterium]|nr:ribosome maturation factor RimP [Actinomycetota bacterium]